MIVVRVELHSAVTGRVTELARVDVCNTGGDHKIGNYECKAYRGRTREALAKRIVQRRGVVLNHRRLQEHVLNLIAKSLASMGYGQSWAD